MEKGSNKVMTTALVTLAVGALLGGVSGYAIAANNAKDMKQSDMTAVMQDATAGSSGADLRATLVSFGTEHMDLTYGAVNTALAGAPSAQADQAALIQNGKDLAAAVGSVYGEEAQKTFEQVWTIHLTEFVNYAVAASKGDDAGKQAALNTINEQYTKPLAAYLAKANPNLLQDVLEQSLSEHVAMTAVMIDAQAAGNYAEATTQRNESVTHLEGLMTTLAGGIVKQFPEKFSNQ